MYTHEISQELITTVLCKGILHVMDKFRKYVSRFYVQGGNVGV